MTEASRQYDLDPCRRELGAKIHGLVLKRMPDGVALAQTPDDLGRLLEQPPEAAMGDYALPCFPFAKTMRLPPQKIAADLAAELVADGWVERAQAVGAFLNIFINPARMAQVVLTDIRDGKAMARLAANPVNSKSHVMIEFSQPNTHKEFHVGHARNVSLGNALVRLFRACGYRVSAANYFGDDGTHIAIVLWHLSKNKIAAPASGRGTWLGQMYVAARRTLSEATPEQKETYQKEISEVHRQIESKTGAIYRLWQETRQWSLDSFDEVYRWLDVPFDVLFYESDVTEEAQAIVEEYYKKGVFVLDQGAIGVDLKEDKLGFCILRKSDGNTLYATKDLALARRKFEDYKVDRSIYVVGAEQIHHFRQVFKVLERMGFAQARQCFHLSYGLVMLPEGKMSSRDGTSVTFDSLRDEMMAHLSEIMKKYQGEWSEDEIRETTRQLCAGAIKYGMISTDPNKEIIYNLENWLAFDGNSGPYLMYSYTRTQSILRKAAEAGACATEGGAHLLTHAAEKALMRWLYDFPAAVIAACESYRPSQLASHLFYMCKAFNHFYAEVSVLKAETDALRGARLALIEAFATVLRSGLGVLGLTPPRRM